MRGQRVKVAVVVPTYQRPPQLRDCLASLAPQVEADDELIVVHRADDRGSLEVLRSFPRARGVVVAEPGLLQAMEVGARSSSAAVVAFTDDDAVPSATWLAQLRAHFQDDSVGAVGGRDRVWTDGVVQHADCDLLVGQIGRWGGHHGNHHLGRGQARTVDIVKGVNMAWRRTALAFPRGLAGQGAQPHNEIAISAWARRQGFQVIYDPELVVDHYPGQRFDPDGRVHRSSQAVRDESYNLSRAATAWPHTSRLGILLRGTLVGERATPGMARWLAGRAGLASRAQGLGASFRGRLRAAMAPSLSFAPLETPPSVLLLAHDLHTHGGMERCLHEQVSRLRHRFQFRVVSAAFDPPLSGVEHRRVRHVPGPFMLRFAGYFLRAPLRGGYRERTDCTISVGVLSARRADVVLLHYLHSGYSGPRGSQASAGRWTPRRLNGALLRRVFAWLETFQYRRWAPVIVAVSHGLGEEVRRRFPGSEVHVVPNGLDDELFAPRPDERARLRSSLDLTSDDRVALFVGGDWQRKGLEICIEALGRLRRQSGLDVHLLVVGGGDEAGYSSIARAVGVADLVHFLGHLDDTRGIYAAGDVLLLPSAYETFSLVAHEAAAAGRPIIGTPVHGVHDIIRAGGGIAVTRDAASVAAALHDLVADQSRASAMGEAAQDHARRFNWDASAEALGDVMESVIARKRAERGRS